MRTSFLLPALALLAVAPPAFAHDEHRSQDPWYLQFGLGGAFGNSVDSPLGGEVRFDPGFMGSLAVGRDMGKFFSDRLGWALEFEGVFTSYRVKEEDLVPFGTQADGVEEVSWMGNLIFDVHFNRSTALYFGGGLGFASSISYDTFDTGNFTQVDDSGVAFNLRAGFRWHLGGLLDFILGYRLQGTEDLKVRNNITTNTFDLENTRHVIEAGMRWGL